MLPLSVLSCAKSNQRKRQSGTSDASLRGKEDRDEEIT